MSYGRLDYPAEKLAPFGREKLTMEANTEQEKGARLHACEKEPWTIAMIESLEPGEVFWDIGANVGPYTLLAAARKLGVVAFEPMAENYATLIRNLALNGLMDAVLALPIALGDGDGLIWLHHSDMRSGAASHTLSVDPKKITLHKQLVVVLAAATASKLFQMPPPNAIKLDVDGSELAVLIGLEETLQAPGLRVLMIELQRNEIGQQIVAFLKERGWNLSEAFDPRGTIQYAKFSRERVDVESPLVEAAGRAIDAQVGVVHAAP